MYSRFTSFLITCPVILGAANRLPQDGGSIQPASAAEVWSSLEWEGMAVCDCSDIGTTRDRGDWGPVTGMRAEGDRDFPVDQPSVPWSGEFVSLAPDGRERLLSVVTCPRGDAALPVNNPETAVMHRNAGSISVQACVPQGIRGVRASSLGESLPMESIAVG